jgi:hypothetical protein
MKCWFIYLKHFPALSANVFLAFSIQKLKVFTVLQYDTHLNRISIPMFQTLNFQHVALSLLQIIYIYIYLFIAFTRFSLHTSNSAGLLWTSKQHDAQTSTWQHATHARQTSMPPAESRTHNSSNRVAADPHLRPRGHWDGPRDIQVYQKFSVHLVVTVQKVTSNVQSVPSQSPEFNTPKCVLGDRVQCSTVHIPNVS